MIRHARSRSRLAATAARVFVEELESRSLLSITVGGGLLAPIGLAAPLTVQIGLPAVATPAAPGPGAVIDSPAGMVSDPTPAAQARPGDVLGAAAAAVTPVAAILPATSAPAVSSLGTTPLVPVATVPVVPATTSPLNELAGLNVPATVGGNSVVPTQSAQQATPATPQPSNASVTAPAPITALIAAPANPVLLPLTPASDTPAVASAPVPAISAAAPLTGGAMVAAPADAADAAAPAEEATEGVAPGAVPQQPAEDASADRPAGAVRHLSVAALWHDPAGAVAAALVAMGVWLTGPRDRRRVPAATADRADA